MGLLVWLLLSGFVYWTIGCYFHVPLHAFTALCLGVPLLLLIPSPKSPPPKDTVEALLFWGFLFFGIWIKSFSPEIDLGEKFPDLMILNAVTLDTTFPPMDRWMSGHTLNYYYFSYLSNAPSFIVKE